MRPIDQAIRELCQLQELHRQIRLSRRPEPGKPGVARPAGPAPSAPTARKPGPNPDRTEP